jgi:hypothetical protein
VQYIQCAVTGAGNTQHDLVRQACLVQNAIYGATGIVTLSAGSQDQRNRHVLLGRFGQTSHGLAGSELFRVLGENCDLGIIFDNVTIAERPGRMTQAV